MAQSIAKVLALNVGFRSPEPKEEALAAVLADWLADGDARETVEIVDDARGAMVNAIASEYVDPQQKAAGTLRYLPLVRMICASWGASPAAQAPQQPQLWWKTGMGGLVGFKAVEGFGAETTMTLACLAAAHALQGMNASTRDVPEYKVAATAFCSAAGVYDAMEKMAAPFDARNHPLELSPALAEAMRDLCMASAHRLTVAFSLGQGDEIRGGAVKAKLCAGYVAVLEAAISTMRSKAGNEFEQLQQAFRTCLAFHVAVGRGLMWLFAAVGHSEKDESGHAIYCVRQALLFLRERPSLMASGYPPLEGFLQEVATDVEAVRDFAVAKEAEYVHDNNVIYFNAIPTELPAPTAATIMKVTPFEMPPASGDMLQFVQVQPESRGFFGLFGSSGLSNAVSEPAADVPPPNYDSLKSAPVIVVGTVHGAPAPGVPSAGQTDPPPALQKSDSDLARELQERWNAGEDW